MYSKIAFLFPGQGSQTLSMLNTLAVEFPIIQSTFERASEVVGENVWTLAQQGPLEKLNRTVYTQPVLLTAGFAVWQLWQQQGGKQPHFLAGHSLGEYLAYTCADSLSFEEGLHLVSKRALYMEQAVPASKGAMGVIVGLTADHVNRLCSNALHLGYVAAANYNAPDQIVISGYVRAVNHVLETAKSSGAYLTKKISVSVPAHCDLMRPAAQSLGAALDHVTFKVPTIPIVNNVSACIQREDSQIKETLVKQLYCPVQWMDSIQYLLDQGVEYFIECGPGKILSGLVKKIAHQKPITVLPMGEINAFKKALSFFN